MYSGSSQQVTALKLGLANEVEYFMSSGPDDDCGAVPSNPSDMKTGFPFDDVCNDVSVYVYETDSKILYLFTNERAIA